MVAVKSRNRFLVLQKTVSSTISASVPVTALRSGGSQYLAVESVQSINFKARKLRL